MQRDAAAAAVLNSADVVFSTLAFSGSATFRKITAAFETIVIDEAAQALEPSCLVPLSPSVRQVYLIGDPIQLPATVISKRAVKANFEQSLFKRLQDAGYPVHILQVRTLVLCLRWLVLSRFGRWWACGAPSDSCSNV